MRQTNHAGYDGLVLPASPEPGHEGAVDLEVVDGEALEVVHGRVARAEIVHGESDAQGLEPPQGHHGLGGVPHHRALGDLEGQRLGLQPGLPKGLGHLLDQPAVAELPDGEVDEDRRGHLPGLADTPGKPSSQDARLVAGLAQYPTPDGDDEARLLREWDELRGGHQATLRVLPPDERLHADRPAAPKVHLGLVAKHELLPLQRPPEIGLQP